MGAGLAWFGSGVFSCSLVLCYGARSLGVGSQAVALGNQASQGHDLLACGEGWDER